MAWKTGKFNVSRLTTVSYDVGEENRPQNDFEKLLLDYKCSLRSDVLDCQQICLGRSSISIF